ncbi:hypothetical protein [Mucilaginibacter boryungensis]|uniref:Uncharacterized protein n=1 Tax=Mucilaginibacter boryungensis TaxID=768480 RepID=A0ABR9XK83_9SPHI|nr:hypothetical protein [Mucilaginibacter boryungensis]MBE9667788.1 hypothetical protein [Mucilaginibacter boryungensis]
MKKYILKPGKHQFVPGEHARHNNDNLTDAEAKWYLERYPHIRSMFRDSPEPGETKSLKAKRKRIGEIIPKSVKSKTNENLPATN